MITSTAIGTGGLGRFGNQLFTIAGVIGIAIRSGQSYGFPKWKNYDNALFGEEVTDFSEVFLNPLPDTKGERFNEYGYFWGYRDIKLPVGNWSINAHMQSPKFFRHCINTIRYYFTMKNEPEQNDYVAIHYRAGDYINDPDAYHPRCSKEYYMAAVKIIREFHGANQKFILFSDDRIEAATLFDFIDYEFPTGSYLDEFKLMKKCKSFIIANSSFSAMAAHLGEHPDKKVVAPERWFGKIAGLETKDIYESDWIVI